MSLYKIKIWLWVLSLNSTESAVGIIRSKKINKKLGKKINF